jgi:hypothetical protein
LFTYSDTNCPKSKRGSILLPSCGEKSYPCAVLTTFEFNTRLPNELKLQGHYVWCKGQGQNCNIQYTVRKRNLLILPMVHMNRHFECLLYNPNVYHSLVPKSSCPWVLNIREYLISICTWIYMSVCMTWKLQNLVWI